MIMNLHKIELDWIHQLQNALRCPFLDNFFIGFSYVDSTWFLIILVAIVWYLINRDVGISLLFIFIISGVINHFLKIYFDLPRPCQAEPILGVICLSSPGFPSGAAQSATLISGVIFAKCKNKIFWIAGLLFAFLLCFSRIYLGVHYFSDILGGIVVGGFLLIIYLKVFPLIEKNWWKFAIALSIFFMIVGGLKLISQATLTLGIAVGLLLTKMIEVDRKKSWYIRSMETLTVILGTCALLSGGIYYPHLKIYFAFVSGLWFSYLGSWLIQKVFGLMGHKST